MDTSDMTEIKKRILYLIVFTNIIIDLIVLAKGFKKSDILIGYIGYFGFVVGVEALAIMPFLIIYNYLNDKNNNSFYINIILISLVGLYYKVNGFFIHKDAQGGLLFFTLPIAQLFLACVIYVVYSIICKLISTEVKN